MRFRHRPSNPVHKAIPALCLAAVSLSVLLGGLTSYGFAAEEKREQTQYERRLQMLANRYSRLPAGTVEFPKELMAVDYINEGYKLYEKNQYDLAAEAADQALQYDPKSPVAHELLADIAYLNQDLTKANEHYRAAFQLEPNARLKQKLEKLSREMSAEKDLNTVEEMHFLIKYDRNKSEYEGFELRMLLHETYLAVARDLGHYLNHKTTVLFYDADQFHQVGDLPHWVGGLFDGKVRLPVHPRKFAEKQLRAVARHELTHVFLSDISGGRAPVWLQEGLATYEQNKIDRTPERALRLIADPRKRLPLDELFNSAEFEKHKNDEAWLNVFYVQSYDLTDYIIGRYGIFYVKQMAQEFGKGKDVEQVISEVLKISIVKLEKEWQASLASTFR